MQLQLQLARLDAELSTNLVLREAFNVCKDIV
jgi:hypothetical protein